MPCREAIGAHPIFRDPTRRAVFGEFGCVLYGWPSKGGVIIRTNADTVELKQLGFDPLDPPATRCKDQEKEDAFCQELRKIGGRWWRSERRYLDVNFRSWDESEPEDDELKAIWLGWPEDGGLLVLECKGSEGIPDDVGRLRMACSMEERCKLLRERFGATFYEDPATYAGFADGY